MSENFSNTVNDAHETKVITRDGENKPLKSTNAKGGKGGSKEEVKNNADES
ncbi:MAG: hypothetical protein OEV28_08510 [Nitrospirota bacterium]|nr:hypothetical protein [Nitrospirota bacterium]